MARTFLFLWFVCSAFCSSQALDIVAQVLWVLLLLYSSSCGSGGLAVVTPLLLHFPPLLPDAPLHCCGVLLAALWLALVAVPLPTLLLADRSS